ncbi:hypothetical protein, partial [Mesorhizobium jarvisii]|uniref:hypothetical protein n=1 Tax=Mesorhizobium jarvisii TaxID=1777867 RepID=UPI0030B8E882
DRRQKQFGWIEGVGPALETGVKNEFGILGRGDAASCIDPSGFNAVFEHGAPASTRAWEARYWRF